MGGIAALLTGPALLAVGLVLMPFVGLAAAIKYKADDLQDQRIENLFLKNIKGFIESRVDDTIEGWNPKSLSFNRNSKFALDYSRQKFHTINESQTKLIEKDLGKISYDLRIIERSKEAVVYYRENKKLIETILQELNSNYFRTYRTYALFCDPLANIDTISGSQISISIINGDIANSLPLLEIIHDRQKIGLCDFISDVVKCNTIDENSIAVYYQQYSSLLSFVAVMEDDMEIVSMIRALILQIDKTSEYSFSTYGYEIGDLQLAEKKRQEQCC